MICEICFGRNPLCPECGGCGFVHCCEGERPMLVCSDSKLNEIFGGKTHGEAVADWAADRFPASWHRTRALMASAMVPQPHETHKKDDDALGSK